jgi:hypothetical protein
MAERGGTVWTSRKVDKMPLGHPWGEGEETRNRPSPTVRYRDLHSLLGDRIGIFRVVRVLLIDRQVIEAWFL